MSKTEYTLLIVLLAFSIVFLGGAEMETRLGQDLKATTAQLPANSSLPAEKYISSTGILNYFNTGFNKASPDSGSPFGPTQITSLLFDRVQKPCWLRLAEYQRQAQSIYRTSYITKLNIISDYKYINQDEQNTSVVPSVFSKNLISNSPPGLIQRL